MGRVILGLFCLFLSGNATTLWACSSCGSGGADPVILNPSESHKLYLGLGVQSAFQDIDSQGQLRKSDGPDSKWLLELAYVRRFTNRIFASVVGDLGLNQKHDREQAGVGDVTLNTRATLLQPTMLEPELPQLQLLLSRRFATGRSVNQSREEAYLDVYGAGSSEFYAGFDAWWGMMPVLFGFSYLHGWPSAEEIPEGTLQQGQLQRFIVTGGHMLAPELKLIGGVIADQRRASELDTREQERSSRRLQSLFLTLETLHPEGDNLRVTLTRRGVLGDNRNGVSAWGITLAWMSLL